MYNIPFHYVAILIFLIGLNYLIFKLVVIFKQIKSIDKSVNEKAFKEKLDYLIDLNEKNKTNELNEEFFKDNN